jgi:LPS export ABC transporter protein LptC
MKRALALAVLVAGCARTPAPGVTPPPADATPTPVPVHVVSNGSGSLTTLTEMKRGHVIYRIRATSFTVDTIGGPGGAGNGAFEHPQITFIDRNGAQTVATAPKAALTGADKTVVMTGGVRARSQDGNVLHCDRLRYNGNTERLHGDGHVRLETPSGFVLTGDRLDGDAQLADVRVARGQ